MANKPGRPVGTGYATRRTLDVGIWGINPDLFHKKYTINENGCWIWQGAQGPHGTLFGVAKRGKPAMTQATRVSWMIEHGEIPPGKYIIHGCNHRMCVNPHHLKPATPQERKNQLFDTKPNRKVNSNTPNQWLLSFNLTPEQNPLNDEFKAAMQAEIEPWQIARHGVNFEYRYSWITITQEHAFQIMLKYPQYKQYMRPI